MLSHVRAPLHSGLPPSFMCPPAELEEFILAVRTTYPDWVVVSDDHSLDDADRSKFTTRGILETPDGLRGLNNSSGRQPTIAVVDTSSVHSASTTASNRRAEAAEAALAAEHGRAEAALAAERGRAEAALAAERGRAEAARTRAPGSQADGPARLVSGGGRDNGTVTP
jgi:hypothetical protein